MSFGQVNANVAIRGQEENWDEAIEQRKSEDMAFGAPLLTSGLNASRCSRLQRAVCFSSGLVGSAPCTSPDTVGQWKKSLHGSPPTGPSGMPHHANSSFPGVGRLGTLTLRRRAGSLDHRAFYHRQAVAGPTPVARQEAATLPGTSSAAVMPNPSVMRALTLASHNAHDTQISLHRQQSALPVPLRVRPSEEEMDFDWDGQAQDAMLTSAGAPRKPCRDNCWLVKPLPVLLHNPLLSARLLPENGEGS